MGLRSRFLAYRQRDRGRTARAYRALPFRTWIVRTAALVALTAVLGALFSPLWGEFTRGEGAYYGAVLQLAGQVTWRLLGRLEDRRESGM
jgi:heme A synthase